MKTNEQTWAETKNWHNRWMKETNHGQKPLTNRAGLIEEYYPENNQWHLIAGNRRVIAYNQDGTWYSRLYVNKGETATTSATKHATTEGVKRWAAKILA